jgi:hypothetical protein
MKSQVNLLIYYPETELKAFSRVLIMISMKECQLLLTHI